MCVEECPDNTYSPLAYLKLGESEVSIKEKMRPYCKVKMLHFLVNKPWELLGMSSIDQSKDWML